MPGCPPEMPAKETLSFGKIFSPHMLRCRYTKDGGGWQSPEIVPFQNIALSPAASSLHYGLECFEGMKAYKTLDDEDDIRLFRPDMNMKRLKDSMTRLAMPGADFDPQELIDCVGKLVRLGETDCTAKFSDFNYPASNGNTKTRTGYLRARDTQCTFAQPLSAPTLTSVCPAPMTFCCTS